MKKNITPLAHKALLLGSLFCLSTGFASAATYGFIIGATNNGSWGLQNISTGGYHIDNLSITLPATTFFDSLPTAPGVSSSGWQTLGTLGTITPVYPTDAATDGLSVANLSFNADSFGDGEILNFDVDLDLFANPDFDGLVGGAVVTANFRDVSNAFIGSMTLTLQEAPISLNGFNYTHSAIPEPSAAILGCVGLFGLLRRRRN